MSLVVFSAHSLPPLSVQCDLGCAVVDNTAVPVVTSCDFGYPERGKNIVVLL